MTASTPTRVTRPPEPRFEARGPEAQRVLEDAAAQQISIVRIRELVGVARLDTHDAIRLDHRRPMQVNRADAHVQDGVEADTEPQRERADDHESRASPEAANAVAHVLPHAVHPGQHPDRARILTRRRGATHRAPRRTRGIPLRQATLLPIAPWLPLLSVGSIDGAVPRCQLQSVLRSVRRRAVQLANEGIMAAAIVDDDETPVCTHGGWLSESVPRSARVRQGTPRTLDCAPRIPGACQAARTTPCSDRAADESPSSQTTGLARLTRGAALPAGMPPGRAGWPLH